MRGSGEVREVHRCGAACGFVGAICVGADGDCGAREFGWAGERADRDIAGVVRAAARVACKVGCYDGCVP